MQSWDFLRLSSQSWQGSRSSHCLKSKGEIIAAYAGVVETARRGRHLAVAGGPTLDWQNRELVKAIFRDLRLEGEKTSLCFRASSSSA